MELMGFMNNMPVLFYASVLNMLHLEMLFSIMLFLFAFCALINEQNRESTLVWSIVIDVDKNSLHFRYYTCQFFSMITPQQ